MTASDRDGAARRSPRRARSDFRAAGRSRSRNGLAPRRATAIPRVPNGCPTCLSLTALFCACCGEFSKQCSLPAKRQSALGRTAMTGLTQSYVNGVSEQPLFGETIGQFFDAVCTKWASRPALIVRHQKVRLSYAELQQQVDKLAAGLLTLGLAPGERIGIWSPNNSE